jgi:hypothetical protein
MARAFSAMLTGRFGTAAVIAEHQSTAAALRRDAMSAVDPTWRAFLESAAIAYDVLAQKLSQSAIRAAEIRQTADRHTRAQQLKHFAPGHPTG